MIRKITTHRILPLLAAGLLLGACDDDPTGVDEHYDVEGVAIFEGTTELYRYMLDDGTPSTFTVPQGTHEVVMVLLDHDGEPLEEHDHDHDHEGEEIVLDVNIDDAGILTWTPEDHGHAHEFIEFHGELDAVQPGSTTMELCVPHGDHCDFDADVPVMVTGA
jgi:hypothetical protein